ncbi:MAG: PHP domain-containing protein [Halanaerobiales bacterium]
MAADLHFHSIYSDGNNTPAELIEMAISKGIDTVALSDHDTVEGVAEMIEIGNEKGVEVIPAIEFSTYQGEVEMHILGYYIDYRSKTFLSKIHSLFRERIARSRKMVKKLNDIGININYQDVVKTAGDKYVGRPHIARAMISAGYINNIEEAFTEDYIGNRGKAYVSKDNLSPLEAIELIHKAGGIAVLAHPYLINDGAPFDKNGIINLANQGLEGIEVFHSKQSQEISEYYLKIARELDLLVTGGSDFHGNGSVGLQLGDVLLDDQYVAQLKDFYNRKYGTPSGK